MTPDQDSELVRQLLGGDEAERQRALAELFDRHQRRVFNVALRVLGDWDRAQDVVQDVFMNLDRRVASFRGDASFTSWIYRITVNRAIDLRRREARRPAVRVAEVPPDARPASSEAGPAEPSGRVFEDERAQRVQDALMQLSPKLRAVAVLRYVEGLSYEELAEALDCSMGTIKSRLNRAHRALTRGLGDLAPPGRESI